MIKQLQQQCRLPSWVRQWFTCGSSPSSSKMPDSSRTCEMVRELSVFLVSSDLGRLVFRWNGMFPNVSDSTSGCYDKLVMDLFLVG